MIGGGWEENEKLHGWSYMDFRTVATIFLKKIGKIRFNSLSSREKCSKNGKNGQCLQTAKLRKKEKDNTGIEVYTCALKINDGKTCCETNGHIGRGSKVQGPMNSSNLIGRKL
jgi:hypothetical protein